MNRIVRIVLTALAVASAYPALKFTGANPIGITLFCCFGLAYVGSELFAPNLDETVIQMFPLGMLFSFVFAVAAGSSTSANHVLPPNVAIQTLFCFATHIVLLLAPCKGGDQALVFRSAEGCVGD